MKTNRPYKNPAGRGYRPQGGAAKLDASPLQVFDGSSIMHIVKPHGLGWIGAIAMLTLAGCAPAPIYKTTPDTLAIAPVQVAQTPEHFANATVVWGGRVVTVQNFPDHSEMEVLTYPLDSSQRPKLSTQATGRFIAILPGYVEALSYPSGAPITIAGKLNGSRAGKVGDADYVFPLVVAAQSHVWTPAELSSGKVSFGVGVGVGIR
jgi:outer membrane lipoprotein